MAPPSDNHATNPSEDVGDWYGVMAAVQRSRPRIDLSTGEPLHDEGLQAAVGEWLGDLSAQARTLTQLASYDELDGAPEFLDAVAVSVGPLLGENLGPDRVLAVPGVQASLRYVLAHLREAGAAAFYPVGLEFPGAVDPEGARQCGRARWSPDGRIIELDIDDIDKRARDGVGAVLLSRPHSPTGRVWPAEDMERLAAVTAERGAWLVVDATYGLPGLALQRDPIALVRGSNVIHLFSFSKVGLAGERVGAVVGPAEAVNVLRKHLRRSTITASRLGQLLAARLLQHAAQLLPTPRLASAYETRWAAAAGELSGLHERGVSVAVWQGGPFAWTHWRGNAVTDTEVFRATLAAGVAVAPGTPLHACGEPQHAVRIGLGSSVEQVSAAASALRAVLEARIPAAP